MRYATPTRNRIRWGRAVAAPVAAAGLAIQSCAAIGGGRAQPDLVGDEPSELNWSFADAARLQDEIADLKSENAKLKAELASLERAKKEAEAEANEIARRRAATAVSQAKATLSPAGEARAPSKTVIAAADIDRALADAPPPVEASPRLVKPSFSDEKAVFENEAASGEVRLTAALFGVHLASYKTLEKARAGWSELQRAFPDELGLLEPRIEQVMIPGRGEFLRLIGGGFSSQDKALSLCKLLRDKGKYCEVAGFRGERLSVVEASG